MSGKFRLAIVFIVVILTNFSFSHNYGQCAEKSSDDLNGFKKGRIVKVDYARREINLEDMENLKITDITLNVVDNKRTWKNIKELYEGLGLLVKYSKPDKIIREFWIINNQESYYDLKNFIYVREKSVDKVIQSYYLGDVDLMNINAKNQVHLIINNEYLATLSDIHDKELKIKTTVHSKGGQANIWQLSEDNYSGEEILYAGPIVYDLDDLGLEEGDRIKIKVSIQQKSQESEENQEGWKNISSREVRLQIKRFGFRPYSSETISFVRDSFGKSWKPSPGASVTVGISFFTSRETSRLPRTLAKIWNTIDPRIGINFTLLDFDEDKNMEYGLGPVISVFKGGIYLGVGWNLSTKRRKNRYAFFGISLTRIGEKIKGQFTEET